MVKVADSPHCFFHCLAAAIVVLIIIKWVIFITFIQMHGRMQHLAWHVLSHKLPISRVCLKRKCRQVDEWKYVQAHVKVKGIDRKSVV